MKRRLLDEELSRATRLLAAGHVDAALTVAWTVTRAHPGYFVAWERVATIVQGGAR